jgi:hypothetical protein
VVGQGRPNAGTYYRGLLWESDGDGQELGTLTSGASADWDLSPRAINDAGQIVGWARQDMQDIMSSRAFLLTPPH